MTVQGTFQIGKTYSQRFMCDYDQIASFTILSRTAKTVTVDVHGKTVRRGLSVHDGVESFKPFGSYAMAMVVRATDLDEPDFTLADHGSIMILQADTDAAREWIDEHLPADRTTWGPNGTVIEPRYVADVVQGLINDGLTISR